MTSSRARAVSTVVAVIGTLQSAARGALRPCLLEGQATPKGQGGPARRSGEAGGSHFVPLRYKTILL